MIDDDDRSAGKGTPSLLLMIIGIFVLVGIVMAFLAFRQASDAVAQAQAANRLSLSSLEKYSVLASSWSELDGRVNIAENHAVTAAQVSDNPETGKAMQESDSDRIDLWNSLKKLTRRVRHLEMASRKTHSPVAEKPVEQPSSETPVSNPDDNSQPPISSVLP